MASTQTWLITGAARGLGRAITEQALDAGHTVVATVRGPHTLVPHRRLDVRHLDVRDRADAHRTVAEVAQEHGRLDVMVNNAGYGLVGAIEEAGEDEVRDIVETDLLGALWLAQAAVAVMRQQRTGHVVQISTVGAVGTMPTFGLYNAAKWGLEGFSEALAAEVRGFGVRVTIAELGAIDTEWATGSMKFSRPLPAYDELRTSLFGTPTVPWPSTSGATGGGTSPAEAARVLLDHVSNPSDRRMRVLVGDDAPGQVATALRARTDDYALDPRWRPSSNT